MGETERELRKALYEANLGFGELAGDVERLARERDEVRQRAERLREALLKYGEHQSGCHIAEEDIFGPLDDCSCGLRAALAADPQPVEAGGGGVMLGSLVVFMVGLGVGVFVGVLIGEFRRG